MSSFKSVAITATLLSSFLCSGAQSQTPASAVGTERPRTTQTLNVTVTAQDGETVAQIAARYCADLNEASRLSGIAPDASLARGTRVRISAPLDCAPPPPSGAPPEEVRLARQPEQVSCSLRIPQSPTIRGLKLGMPLTEVRSLFPSMAREAALLSGIPGRTVPDETGFLSKYIYSPNLTNKNFEGIDELQMDFLDGRLVSFSVDYDYSTKWAGIDEFVSKMSSALNLPMAWTDNRMVLEEKSKRMDCDGFQVVAEIELSSGSIKISEVGITEIRQRRRKEVESKRREAFKP
jgi:hypothetical protein